MGDLVWTRSEFMPLRPPATSPPCFRDDVRPKQSTLIMGSSICVDVIVISSQKMGPPAALAAQILRDSLFLLKNGQRL